MGELIRLTKNDHKEEIDYGSLEKKKEARSMLNWVLDFSSPKSKYALYFTIKAHYDYGRAGYWLG